MTDPEVRAVAFPQHAFDFSGRGCLCVRICDAGKGVGVSTSHPPRGGGVALIEGDGIHLIFQGLVGITLSATTP